MSARTALELLENNLDREKPFLSKEWPFIAGFNVGFWAVCLANYSFRRPMFSGLQRSLGLGLAIGTASYFLRINALNHHAERDAMYRHYVMLHPEDFIMPERQKYSQLLENWVPVR